MVMLELCSRARRKVSLGAAPEPLEETGQNGCRGTVHRPAPSATPATSVRTRVGRGPTWTAARPGAGTPASRPSSRSTGRGWEPGTSHLEQLLVVDHETAVHDARDAGGGCTPPRRGVHHADLQPDQTGLHGDRLVHDRTRELAAPEHVYDIDGARRRRRGERRVAPLAEHGLVLGVHRYDAVAGLLEVSRHLMAGPPGLGRQAYDRDRRRFPQEGAQRLRVHASGRWMCGVPLTARPTSTMPARWATVSASVDGTLGVATYARPARAALCASSAEMRPVTSSPRPAIGCRAITAAPITLSTALCRPMSSAWN